MWFQNSALLPLKVDIKCSNLSSGSCDLDFYDQNFVRLPVDAQNDQENFVAVIQISLPTKIVIDITINQPNTKMDIQRLWLVGLPVDKNLLKQCCNYRIGRVNTTLNSLDALQALESQDTAMIEQSGYFVIDLFHPNPFAWHLAIGNKIKYK
jgi:hypothetical protein